MEVGRQYFDQWWEWEADSRTQLVQADVFEFIQATDKQFDLIILDTPVVLGADSGRFEKDFYQELQELLTPEGLLVAQCDAPRYRKEVFCSTLKVLQNLFGEGAVYPYLVPIPTYPGGLWSFSICMNGRTSLQPNLLATDKAIPQDLQYYNAAIHNAAFALPNDIRNLIKGN